LTGITFDTGALIALERRRQRMKEIVERALAKDQPLTVPADVVGEWWRGRTDLRDAILESVDVEPLTEALAKLAGEALGASKGRHSSMPSSWLLRRHVATSSIRVMSKISRDFEHTFQVSGYCELDCDEQLGERKLGVSGSLHQPLDPLPEPDAIVRNVKKIGLGRRVRRQVGAGHFIFGIFGEEGQPFRQPPLIEQIGLVKQKVFHVRTIYRLHVILLRLQRL